VSKHEAIAAWAAKVREIEALNLTPTQRIRLLEGELLQAMVAAAQPEQTA
jgi:hypothetical protein